MHSSRMRTVRLPGGVPGLRGGGPGPGRGCTWSGGVPGLGGFTWFQGVYLVTGGVPGPVGCTWSQGGVPGPGPGTYPCGQTDTCKNITFATSLRTVKMSSL